MLPNSHTVASFVTQNINPVLLLAVFLPVLLFGSAASAHWHTVRRQLPGILLLAFPGGSDPCLSLRPLLCGPRDHRGGAFAMQVTQTHTNKSLNNVIGSRFRSLLCSASTHDVSFSCTVGLSGTEANTNESVVSQLETQISKF
jgi:hypothetical protein